MVRFFLCGPHPYPASDMAGYGGQTGRVRAGTYHCDRPSPGGWFLTLFSFSRRFKCHKDKEGTPTRTFRLLERACCATRAQQARRAGGDACLHTATASSAY